MSVKTIKPTVTSKKDTSKGVKTSTAKLNELSEIGKSEAIAKAGRLAEEKEKKEAAKKAKTEKIWELINQLYSEVGLQKEIEAVSTYKGLDLKNNPESVNQVINNFLATLEHLDTESVFGELAKDTKAMSDIVTGIKAQAKPFVSSGLEVIVLENKKEKELQEQVAIKALEAFTGSTGVVSEALSVVKSEIGVGNFTSENLSAFEQMVSQIDEFGNKSLSLEDLIKCSSDLFVANENSFAFYGILGVEMQERVKIFNQETPNANLTFKSLAEAKIATGELLIAFNTLRVYASIWKNFGSYISQLRKGQVMAYNCWKTLLNRRIPESDLSKFIFENSFYLIGKENYKTMLQKDVKKWAEQYPVIQEQKGKDTPKTKLDENGQPMTDENGEIILVESETNQSKAEILPFDISKMKELVTAVLKASGLSFQAWCENKFIEDSPALVDATGTEKYIDATSKAMDASFSKDKEPTQSETEENLTDSQVLDYLNDSTDKNTETTDESEETESADLDELNYEADI
jgi:hypothetical protein